MDFRTCIERLTKELQKELPGSRAHQIMMPLGRQIPNPETFDSRNVKNSSVVILLYEIQNQIYSVLIQRHIYNGVHSGQIGLPGGKTEASDTCYTDTALRECQEEVGIAPHQVTVIGQLSPIYIPPSHFMVYPVLGFLKSPPTFMKNNYEVKKLITYKINLLEKRNIKTKVFHGHNYSIQAPYFDINGQAVWGATAMILSEFMEVLKKIKANS